MSNFKNYHSKLKLLLDDKVFNNSFNYKGLNWAHPIRVSIFNHFSDRFIQDSSDFSNQVESNSINLSIIKKNKKESSIRIFCAIIIFTHKLMFLLLVILKKNRKKINFYFDNFDVQYESKYFNPYSDNLSINGDFINICYSLKGQKKDTYFKYFDTTSHYKLYLRFCATKDIDTTFLSPLQNVINNDCLERVINDVNQINSHYGYFKLILSTIRPIEVYLYDSYNIYSLALIAACNSKGIKVIEQQHGIISPLHLGYYYNNNNPTYANFLCSEFHHYTSQDVEWTKKNWLVSPRPIKIKESAAVTIWKRYFNMNSSSINQLKEISANKIVISIGLTIEPLPEWLEKFLRELDESYLVLIRQHPRYKYKTADYVKKICYAIKNAESEISTSIPLFSLFSISNYFISDGSSTLVDSLSFDLRPIVISEDYAETLFKPYVDSNLIFVALDTNQINKLIKCN